MLDLVPPGRSGSSDKMSSLSTLYGSPQKKLPSVDTVFRQNREYFSSDTCRERSTFVCEESLHESPSTSTG